MEALIDMASEKSILETNKIVDCKTQLEANTQIIPEFLSASGPIDYGLTNDYMFRAILEIDESILIGLIGSLLHLDTNEIVSAVVKNPILLGNSFDIKDFILDIHVLLNDSKIINLEMQVLNEKNWPERSLSYLCRCFDKINRGKDYSVITPVHHIGFLDFSLFDDTQKFYSTYHLHEDSTQHQFTSKFALSVVDLTHIELASDEDKLWEIDTWATLFKAKTWEDIRMIASSNTAMQSAANKLFILNADDIAREKAQARQDAMEREAGYKRAIAERDQALSEKDKEIARLKAELEALKSSSN